MPQAFRLNSPQVATGLERLHKEAFSPSGAGFVADDIKISAVLHEGWSRMTEATWLRGVPQSQDFSVTFSEEATTNWMYELRRSSYVVGQGTWTSCVIRVSQSGDNYIEVFDEEIIRPEKPTKIPDRPADVKTWARDLKAFPKTIDNIPSWMSEIFRAEGIIPPIYNPEFQSVDWKNRRRQVTDRGTDFSIEPVVIDPTLEPGVFAKIGKKLFGG